MSDEDTIIRYAGLVRNLKLCGRAGTNVTLLMEPIPASSKLDRRPMTFFFPERVETPEPGVWVEVTIREIRDPNARP